MRLTLIIALVALICAPTPIAAINPSPSNSPAPSPSGASPRHLIRFANARTFSYPRWTHLTSSLSQPVAVNCAWSAYTCGVCSETCNTGTQTCTRTKTTVESNGGSCSGTTSKTQDCNTQVCAPPACPTVSSPTGYVKVTTKLTMKLTALGSDTDAAFIAKLKTAIAMGADTCENDVTALTLTKGANAVADVTVQYPVDATTATQDSAVHKAVAFMTKCLYMPDWVLPTQAHDSSNTGTATPTLPTEVACPAPKSYAQASSAVDSKDYTGARTALNHIALCNYKTGSSALGTSSMADVCNLLGFSNRKLADPDVKLSELYYKRALQIDVNHVAANGYLGELYVETSKPALAREVLDDLKQMCPPPAGCDSLTYLRDAMAAASMSEGAYVKKLAWDNCFNLQCSPLHLEKGDKIEFKYSSSHDVVKMPDKNAFENCLAGTRVGTQAAGSAGYVLDLSDVGVSYYICGQGSHCSAGQKIEVNVHERYEAPPSAGGSAPCYSADGCQAKAGAAQLSTLSLLLATFAAALAM